MQLYYWLVYSSAELNIAEIEHIVSLCPYLLWCSSELDIPEVIHFTQTIFDIAPTDPMLIESYATRHEILAGIFIYIIHVMVQGFVRMVFNFST